MCMPDSDWPDEPCYGRPSDQPTVEQLRDDWSKYYDYKGKEWMDAKKAEIDDAFKTGIIRDFLDHRISKDYYANYNAFKYYRLLGYISPLKQFQADPYIEHVQCRDGLLLVTKSVNGHPACVREETKSKLINIGWIKTQVDVHNDSAFIESTKSLDAVQTFLSQHPNAKASVDDEWHTVIYEASGFRKHPSSQIIYQTKRLIINLNYDGKPEAYSAECGGGGITLSGPVKPLADPDWCFPLDQSQFSNVTSNMKKSNARNTNEPYTTIEISFGNLTKSKLLPVAFSEITHNAEYMNEILVWNFELIGHNADDRRKTWDVAPKDQRISYKITDEYGKNVIDSTRMPDNDGIPDDLHWDSLDCGLFRTVDGESAHPTVFAVKKGTSTIIAKNSNKGILPISDDKYSFEFASMFEITVKLPKNAQIISQESKQCKLVQGIEGDPDRTYVDGYYTKMVFRLEN